MFHQIMYLFSIRCVINRIESRLFSLDKSVGIFFVESDERVYRNGPAQGWTATSSINMDPEVLLEPQRIYGTP